MISRAIRGALSPFQKSGFFAPLSRHYRKREGIKKEKEKKFGKILADDKMIKLSRKDNEDERLRLEEELKARRKERLKLAKIFDISLECTLYPEVVEEFNLRKRRRVFQLDSNPQELNQLYYEIESAHLEKLRGDKDRIIMF